MNWGGCKKPAPLERHRIEQKTSANTRPSTRKTRRRTTKNIKVVCLDFSANSVLVVVCLEVVDSVYQMGSRAMNEPIALWVPAVERPSWATTDSWWNLKTPDNQRLHKIPFSGANNPRVTWNKAVKDFLFKTRCEWLLSIHSDVVVAPDTLMRLLSWEKPLISALVFMKVGPALPHVWKKYDGDTSGRMVQRINDTRDWLYNHPEWIQRGAYVMEPRPDDALVEIDFTSTSCTLMHRDVLNAMRPLVNDVWFECDDELNGGGEDRRFFQNAISLGYTPYVDRSCVVGHITGDVPASAWDFVAWDSISTWNGTGEPVMEKAE